MIKLINAGFIYPDKTKIGPINLNVNKGEVYLLTGKSGSGKTSVTKMINGVIDNLFDGKRYGELLIDNKNIEEMTIKEVVLNVSSVYQNPKTQFFTDNTTSELVFTMENLGYKISDMDIRLNRVSNFFGVEKLLNRNVLELSGGEKQILCIASTLMNDSNIIVLDEPTSNLDLESILKIRQMILKLKQLNKTILISEHRLNYLKGLVDKVSFLEDGVITRSFTGQEFYSMTKVERKRLSLRSLDKYEFMGFINNNSRKTVEKRFYKNTIKIDKLS